MQQAQIRPSRPDDERVVRLLTELDGYLYRQYPPSEFSAEAQRLYERCGYSPRGPFGEYGDGPVSMFMEKRL